MTDIEDKRQRLRRLIEALEPGRQAYELSRVDQWFLTEAKLWFTTQAKAYLNGKYRTLGEALGLEKPDGK